MTNITAIIIILCVFSVLGLISYFVYEHLTNSNSVVHKDENGDTFTINNQGKIFRIADV